MRILSKNPPASPTDQIQGRLLQVAALFLFLYSLVISLAPAVRQHTWAVDYRWQHWIGYGVWLACVLVASRETRLRLPDRDPFLLPVGSLLAGWGLITIWRIDGGFGLRQTIWLALCFLVIVLGWRLANNLQLLRRYKYLWLTGGLFLTGLTFIFGTYPGGNGPHLWLNLGGFYLQPSEPLKLLLVVYLAAYLADTWMLHLSLLRLVMPTLGLIGVALLLLIGQRDLGTATIFIFLYAAILYVTSGKKRIVAISAGVITLAATAAYLIFDVVRLRIDAWLNPWLDPSGRSYQIVQSLIAVAAGGLFGRGPGIGNPGLVPVAHSDFVFSSIAEETGLFGSLALILILCTLIWRGFRASLRAPESFQRYLAAGLTLYLGAQSLLIIGGNLRLFPLTGVTLPFVSYGGSSLLTSFISLGILLQISNQADVEPARLPNPAPYLYLAGALLVGFFAAGVLDGWWSIYRSQDLVNRFDNPRRVVSDRYVKRGTLMDKNGNALNVTAGSSGSYVRTTTYPPLGAVLGYTNPTYGQAGLEASLDPYLRGIQGNSALAIWWYNLVYGQPPPGLNVRLSLDTEKQTQVDEYLGSHTGAVVLLNAKTGEILAMASHPYFNANQLDTDGQTILNDPKGPLLNRATQGQYPPGTALGAFLLAEASSRGLSPTLPEKLSLTTSGGEITCSQTVAAVPSWGAAVAAGCPAPSVTLAKNLGSADLLDLLKRLGFFETPSVPLQANSEAAPASITNLQDTGIGRGSLKVSPLQMALAAAALSNSGERPSSRLAMTVEVPGQGWVVLPSSNATTAEFNSGSLADLIPSLAAQDAAYWQTVGGAPNGKNARVTWFIGGTLPNWQGTPLAVAVLLEEDNPSLAQQIGAQILQAK